MNHLVIDVVRKWGIKYDGTKDPLAFVERVEELATMYDIQLVALLRVLTEFFKDKALVWYRNNNQQWASWAQFREDFFEFFLPPRYFEKLEDEIRKRTQRPKEPFKDYVLALQDLMRPTQMEESQKLERIFRNAQPDYQWYIKRNDFTCLQGLIRLASDLESIPTSAHHHRMVSHHPVSRRTPGSKSKAETNNRTNITWTAEKVSAVILIHQQPLAAIIDTGATRSFISPTQVRALAFTPQYLDVNIDLFLADGTKRHVSQGLELIVTLGNMTVKCQFLVMNEAAENLVLGLDVLRKFNTTITCAGIAAKSGRSQTAPSTRRKRYQKVSTRNSVISNPRTAPQAERIRSVTCHHPRLNEKPPSGRTSTPPSTKGVPTVTNDSVQQQQIELFLAEELEKFTQIEGQSHIATHRIIMKDDRPIKLRYGPRNPAMQAIIDEEVNKLISQGCIEPSHSPYSFPITLVRKKDGRWRTCMDFRQLNLRSIPDAYPLPRIDTILTRLRNAKYISSLDLKDGYWQIPMHEDSKKYTAFAVAGRGLYQWRVMPFGLHCAPATFQRALDSVIGPDMEPYAFAYLDDIIVIGSTVKEHLENLKEVFRRLREAKLKINVDKCEFFKTETKYLGHLVTQQGIKTDPDKVAAIAQMVPPQNVREIRRFLGVTSWYRRFVPDFATISQPLTQMLKKGKHWKWGQAQQDAFETLKAKLTCAPVLACPDFSQTFILQTDASDYGLGVVLTQNLEGTERVIAYASRHLNPAEKNYSATEKECLAVVWGIRKMRSYLEGYEFIVLTDHLALKWLNSIESPTGRLARWALELQHYRFTIQYRKGGLNIVADALSRNPQEACKRITTQPPQQCQWLDALTEKVSTKPELFPDYTTINGQVYRRFSRSINNEDDTVWKLCVATPLRQRVLRENHDQPTGGHFGVRKTIQKIALRYYWPRMSRDVSRYVRQCESCQKYKVSQQPPAGKMLTQIPAEPWSTVCADFVGPLPRTRHGHTMLLVFFDQFSKWCELVPLRKATAQGVVKAFRERILARYGVPKVFITDNGTQFTAREVAKFMGDMGVRQQFTAPYTPQENPTERANRTIKTMIAQFTGQQHNTWDEVIPEIMLAINTSVSASTQYTPAYLTQGREPRLPKALYDEVALGTGARRQPASDKEMELKEIFQIVRRNLE